MGVPKEKSGGGCVVAVSAAVALGLPAVYVLAMGPALWLYDQEYLDEEVLTVLIYPLALVCDFCPPLADVLQRYMDLWQ